MVDDEASIGELYEMKLRKPIQNGDIRFHFFESANDYLDYLKQSDRHPGAEVLFTDINMPEVSGFELLSKVKKNFPDIDVYMMSAYDDESSIQKSKNLGAKGYFTKPVNYKELQSRIESEYGVSLA
ncbi:response regulator [Bdellovibrio sp. qaytius]|nr:response regulator [Bdellovibrio sp. qaytius]